MHLNLIVKNRFLSNLCTHICLLTLTNTSFFLIIGILFTEIHSGNLLDILEHKFVISYPVETLDSCNSASRNERTLCSAHHDRIFLIRIYQETFHITSEGITKDAVLLLNFLSFTDRCINCISELKYA